MIRSALLTVVCLASLATAVAAHDEHDEHASEEEPSSDFYSFPVTATWRGEVFPDSLLHPPYTADPLRPTMSLTRMFVTSPGIPKTSDSRNYIRVGARVPLLRFSPSGDDGAGIQLDVELGWMAMFDLEKRQDSIGWDGVYGFLLSAAAGRGLSAQIGIKHDSSHPGDELLIRTNYERIGYTRQEFVLGVSYVSSRFFRVYGEFGYGFQVLNTELQEPLRLQAGFLVEDTTLFIGGKAGLFAALDLKSYEESDWQVDMTLQTGVVFPFHGRAPTWRVGLEYRKGRSVLGEFFQYNETWWSFGIWVDF